MLQESVYCKLALNNSVVESNLQKVKKSVPKEGLIQVLVITEKQYTGIIDLVGTSRSDVEGSDQSLIVL